VGGAREEGCIFCNRLRADDDVAALILHRGGRAFVIMNLYPYNTGHVMVVPNEHLASPEEAGEETTIELAALRAPVLCALRRVLAPDGFNLGLNIGAVAGAGVTDHFHEHVVPRWQGDANFMPILAATTVMPEAIPVTYAKLRAEIAREIEGATGATMIVLTATGAEVLIDADGNLPWATALAGEPLWKTLLVEASRLGAHDPEVLGWASHSGSRGAREAMVIRATFPAEARPCEAGRVVSVDQFAGGDGREIVREAVRRFVP
jgi:ATP adenylyltransferase